MTERLSALGSRLPAMRHDANAVGALMEELTEELRSAHVPEARAEARDLVAFALGKPRLWPAAHGDEPVAGEAAAWARAAAKRRARGAPFAYAVGRSDFRSLTLRVDERVLIPRQETEELVELVLKETGGRGTLADIGTGSGAIALALAEEGDFERVIATDVSGDALQVTRMNLASISPRAAARVELREGDLLAPIAGERLDAIVSNPPYVTLGEARELSASVRDWEPPVALFGGADGLDCYRTLVRGAARSLNPRGLLALETDTRRASLVAEMLAIDPRYEQVSVRRDLSGRERFVVARHLSTTTP